MKTIINAFLVSIIFFTIFYLLGSFCNTTFNIKLWDSQSRGLVGFFGGSCSILMGLAYIDISRRQ